MAKKTILLSILLVYLIKTLTVNAKYYRSSQDNYDQGIGQESLEREQKEKWRSNEPSRSSESGRNSHHGNKWKNVDTKYSQTGHHVVQEDYRPAFNSDNSKYQSSEDNNGYGSESRRQDYSKERNGHGYDSSDRFDRADRTFSDSNRSRENRKPKESLCTGPNGMPMLVVGFECPLITTTHRPKRRDGNYQHKNSRRNRKHHGHHRSSISTKKPTIMGKVKNILRDLEDIIPV